MSKHLATITVSIGDNGSIKAEVQCASGATYPQVLIGLTRAHNEVKNHFFKSVQQAAQNPLGINLVAVPGMPEDTAYVVPTGLMSDEVVALVREAFSQEPKPGANKVVVMDPGVRPPIRTVEEFKKSEAEWSAATYYANVAEGDEARRASKKAREEMARMDEARDLFEFRPMDGGPKEGEVWFRKSHTGPASDDLHKAMLGLEDAVDTWKGNDQCIKFVMGVDPGGSPKKHILEVVKERSLPGGLSSMTPKLSSMPTHIPFNFGPISLKDKGQEPPIVKFELRNPYKTQPKPLGNFKVTVDGKELSGDAKAMRGPPIVMSKQEFVAQHNIPPEYILEENKTLEERFMNEFEQIAIDQGVRHKAVSADIDDLREGKGVEVGADTFTYCGKPGQPFAVPSSPEYARLEAQLRALHIMIAEGNGNSKEANTLRDDLEDAYKALPEKEVHRLNILSVELYTAHASLRDPLWMVKPAPETKVAPPTPELVEDDSLGIPYVKRCDLAAEEHQLRQEHPDAYRLADGRDNPFYRTPPETPPGDIPPQVG